MRKWVSPQLEKAQRDLAAITEKIEIRQDLEKILDLTEENLQTQLIQEVAKRQHGDRTADVDTAHQKLVEFHESKWQKERDLLAKIDQSSR
jgi:hypothetical protein